MWRLVMIAVATGAAFACSWSYPIWIPRSRTADAVYRFEKNGKAGYIDAQGKVLIPPSLPALGNSGGEFHDGLLEMGTSNGKYVDTTGKLVIDPGFDRGWDFSEGLAPVLKGNFWGYIDKTGKIAIRPQFETYPNGYVTQFSEGLAAIQVKERFGFIDRSGAFAIAARFLNASSFSDGMSRVVLEGPCVYYPDGPCGMANLEHPGIPMGERPNSGTVYPPCKFSYIDKSGRTITAQRFDGGRDFSEGLAPVRVGKQWGFIDRTGAMVISPRFEDAESFSSGLTRIRANGKYGYADKSGRVVIAPQFEQAESFSEGLAVVAEGQFRSWYIDSEGKRAFGREFGVASPFFKGLAHVAWLVNGKAAWAYIDRTGRVVFSY